MIVNGHRRGVSFERKAVANKAWRDAVAVAIEIQPDIFVNQSLRRVAIIRGEGAERP